MASVVEAVEGDARAHARLDGGEEPGTGDGHAHTLGTVATAQRGGRDFHLIFVEVPQGPGCGDPVERGEARLEIFGEGGFLTLGHGGLHRHVDRLQGVEALADLRCRRGGEAKGGDQGPDAEHDARHCQARTARALEHRGHGVVDEAAQGKHGPGHGLCRLASSGPPPP